MHFMFDYVLREKENQENMHMCIHIWKEKQRERGRRRGGGRERLGKAADVSEEG